MQYKSDIVQTCLKQCYVGIQDLFYTCPRCNYKEVDADNCFLQACNEKGWKTVEESPPHVPLPDSYS